MTPMKSKSISWNLSSLYTSDDDPQILKDRQLVQKVTTQFVQKWKKNNTYLSDPKVLKQALSEFESWRAKYGTYSKESYYFWLRLCQNQTDSKIKAKFNQVDELSRQLQNDIQFFTLSLSKVDKNTQQTFLKDPELQEYQHFLERLFAEGRYLLSENEEKILNLKSMSSYSSWVKATQEFISKEEVLVLNSKYRREKVSFEQLLSLMSHQNKKIRDRAAEAFHTILVKHADLAEHEINAILTDKKIDDQLRKVSRPDEIRHLSDDIDSQVVDALVDVVSRYNRISQRFYKLKAQLLNLPSLDYHERNVPIGRTDQKYDFKQAITLVKKAFGHIDPQFNHIFENFLQGGQIDVEPRKGKRGGAFCAHELLTLPTYILLNHNNKLQDVLTLAHELGHGINNELMRTQQNALNFRTPLSTAEVASTFMEDFVLDELLKDATDKQKLEILMMKLNDDVSTIFRQIACYKFEQQLHSKLREQGYLSKETIGKIFQEEMKAYMGPSVKQSPGSENWWIYWSHIRSYFYVYSYASGLLISKSLQHSVKENPQFIEKVKDFLATGMSESPQHIFQKLGIDITNPSFWENGLKEIEQKLKLTEELAQKLKKTKKS